MNKAKYPIFLLAFLFGALLALSTQSTEPVNTVADTEANCPDKTGAKVPAVNPEGKMPGFIFHPVFSTYLLPQHPLALPLKSRRTNENNR